MKKIAVICIAMLAMTISSFAQQEAEASKTATKWNVDLDFGGSTSILRSYESFVGSGVPYRDDALLVDLTVTYNITRNFELGLATGYFGPTPDCMPLLAVVSYRWLCGPEGKLMPFVRVRGGYDFSLTGQMSCAHVDVGPGLAYQLCPWAAIRGSLDFSVFLGKSNKTKAQYNFAPHIGVEFKF